MPKFNVGDLIIWDGITWRVKKTENDLYELELHNKRQFTTRHGNGGYMDVNTIDESAKRVGNGGSRRRKSKQNKKKINKMSKRMKNGTK